MSCKALSAWHSQASGKKWESVGRALQTALAALWAGGAIRLNPNFLLHLQWQVFTPGDPCVTFEPERFTSVHACCGLSLLLNLREQNGCVWLGRFWRKVWESHFLPVSQDRKSQVASEVTALRTVWAASRSPGLAKLRLRGHTLPVFCTEFSGMEQQTEMGQLLVLEAYFGGCSCCRLFLC